MAFGLVALVLALGTPRRAGAEGRCATEPPPKGLVERCQSKVFFFPSGMSAAFRRAYFEVTLIEWMQTCAIAGRAVGLVYEDQDGLDHVFDLLKDLPALQFVRIVPAYTPLTFSQGGRTCYGVKSVSFRLPAAEGSVDADGPIDTSYGPTSDMIKEAATAGIKALRDPSVRGSAELSRFLRVLMALERSGNDFDDTWYNVQPYATGDPMSSAACYKDFRGGRNVCRPADEALTACERHLAQELVQSYHYDKVSSRRFAEILEIKAADIQRSMDHLTQIQAQDSPAALPCPSIETAFMPKIAELARRHSVYGAGGY